VFAKENSLNVLQRCCSPVCVSDGGRIEASCREGAFHVLRGPITHVALWTKTSHQDLEALFTSAHYSVSSPHSLRVSWPLISCYRRVSGRQQAAMVALGGKIYPGQDKTP